MPYAIMAHGIRHNRCNLCKYEMMQYSQNDACKECIACHSVVTSDGRGETLLSVTLTWSVTVTGEVSHSESTALSFAGHTVCRVVVE